MPGPRDLIPKSRGGKIILQTVAAVVGLLLIPSILATTFGTRIIVRNEIKRQVDQALDGIAYRIDNTLLNVEQTANTISAEIPNHLDNPQKLFSLCQDALLANQSVDGCAIALNPAYHKIGQKPFMAYVHRGRDSEDFHKHQTFTTRPFTEQEWYTTPLLEKRSLWVGPLKNEDTEEVPLISYDVPIFVDSLVVGVLGVDMSLEVLSRIAQNYRTSTNSYITLLDHDGSYIVHPDTTRLLHMDSPTQLKDAEDPEVMEVIREILDGQSGKRNITLGSTSYLVAFMPFRQSAYPGRTVDRLGWSLAVIYPEEDLNKEFDPHFLFTIIFALAGILLLTAGAYVIYRISVRPLKRLMYVTKIISRGNYKLPGFDTSRSDEVGRLQVQYNKMLQSLSGHMEQLQTLSEKEARQEEDLTKIYEETQRVMKRTSDFFGNMTHQMVDVSAEIQANVEKLQESGSDLPKAQLITLLDKIERDGHRMTEILNDMLNEKS